MQKLKTKTATTAAARKVIPPTLDENVLNHYTISCIRIKYKLLVIS